MATKSSSNLGTEQENKTEVVVNTRKTKAKSKTKPKATPKASRPAPTEAVAEDAASVPTQTFDELLSDGRERMDAIDDQILELIARRIQTAGTLLAEKHRRGINPRDKTRQSAIYDRLAKQAAEFEDKSVNLNKHQVREIFELFIRFGVESHRKNIIDRR